VDYAELAARTGGFRHGEPRCVAVSADGARASFLRSAGPEDRAAALWVFDTDSGGERLICDPAGLGLPVPSAAGIESYTTDLAGQLACFAIDGTLVVADLRTGTTTVYPTAEPVTAARPDPTGRRVAYVTGRALHTVDLETGELALLAAEAGNANVSWGTAPFGTGHFGATHSAGFWWSPDGLTVLAARVDETRVRRWHRHDPADPETPSHSYAYPAAGTPTAEVTLHLLDLDGGWVDVHWDRETYPYLVSVSWTDVGGPLVTVLRRLQQHGLVLAVDARTGETQVHAELADPRWVEPVPGTPHYLTDGRVLIGGELAHDGYDARCLFADGGLLTPAYLYVRRVCGRIGTDLLIEASETEPSEQHLYRVGTRSSAAAVEIQRLTAEPGWYTGRAGAETLVIGASSLDHSGTQWTVHSGGSEVGRLRSLAAAPPYTPRPALGRVTDRRLPAGVLYPRAHVSGHRLPVLVDVDGGPGHQEVLAARGQWLDRQWWADNGFAVVVIDNRGTPGIAPSFEKVIHRRFADVALTDQVDALAALAEKHPDLDLSRVAIRGWCFGGWLAALAVLRRPDVYRCAVAGSPVADWLLFDAPYAERYLGLPGDSGDVYAHHSLVEAAAEPVLRPDDARPLLLVQDLTDPRTAPAHTMRLSAALTAAGRPHALLPVSGNRERLLPLELDFVRRNL
jgi:dipeptidyl-peptidase-4